MKPFCWFVALICTNLFARGQVQIHYKMLSGCVKNTRGAPLAGVQLLLCNNNVKARTDSNGFFRLVYPLSYDTLYVYHYGYQSRKIAIRSSMNHLIICLFRERDAQEKTTGEPQKND